jgi:hypothetical protein
MKSLLVNAAMSLDDAMKVVLARGGTVTKRRRTGEVRVVLRGRVLNINCRRKDAPRCLTSLLRRVEVPCAN